jgi:hypothetical protein
MSDDYQVISSKLYPRYTRNLMLPNEIKGPTGARKALRLQRLCAGENPRECPFFAHTTILRAIWKSATARQ